MKYVLLSLAAAFMLIACGPSQSNDSEKKDSESSIWGEITSIKPLGINEFDQNGKKIYDDSFVQESGASLYVGSYDKSIKIYIDGKNCAVEDLKLGMIAKLFSEYAPEESFPATLHHVYKIEAYTH
jgi:hypothetical protein